MPFASVPPKASSSPGPAPEADIGAVRGRSRARGEERDPDRGSEIEALVRERRRGVARSRCREGPRPEEVRSRAEPPKSAPAPRAGLGGAVVALGATDGRTATGVDGAAVRSTHSPDPVHT